jgi:hypothetical protein
LEASSGGLWTLLQASGGLGRLLERLGAFRSLKQASRGFWKLLEVSGDSWRLLEASGGFSYGLPLNGPSGLGPLKTTGLGALKTKTNRDTAPQKAPALGSYLYCDTQM